MNEGTIGSMRSLGITESYKLKRQVVLSASEAAEMILRYVLAGSCKHFEVNISSQGGRYSAGDATEERGCIIDVIVIKIRAHIILYST